MISNLKKISDVKLKTLKIEQFQNKAFEIKNFQSEALNINNLRDISFFPLVLYFQKETKI